MSLCGCFSFLFLSSLFPCLCLCTFSFSFCSCLRIVVAVFLHVLLSQSPIGTCHGDLCLFICDILLFMGDFVSLCGCFDQLYVFFLYVHFFVLIVFIFFKSACGCFFIHLSESSSFCALLFLCLSLRYYTICWAMLTLCGL